MEPFCKAIKKCLVDPWPFLQLTFSGKLKAVQNWTSFCLVSHFVAAQDLCLPSSSDSSLALSLIAVSKNMVELALHEFCISLYNKTHCNLVVYLSFIRIPPSLLRLNTSQMLWLLEFHLRIACFERNILKRNHKKSPLWLLLKKKKVAV